MAAAARTYRFSSSQTLTLIASPSKDMAGYIANDPSKARRGRGVVGVIVEGRAGTEQATPHLPLFLRPHRIHARINIVAGG